MHRLLYALPLAFIGFACGLPSDVSDEFSVVMDTSTFVITIGDVLPINATVVRNGDPVAGAALSYVSSDPTVADITTDGRIRGVSVGQTELTAVAVGYAGAEPVTRLVRVLRAIAIESATPMTTVTPDGRTVSWGELVEIVGVGLDPTGLNLVFVGDRPAPVHSFVAANPSDPTASDTMRIWVPAGASADASILLSRTGGSTAAWPLTVVQQDVLEPNDITPRVLDVGPGGVEVRQLALEIRPWTPGQLGCWSAFGSTSADLCFSDAYTVRASSADITVVVAPEGGLQGQPLSIEIQPDVPSATGWMTTNSYSTCTNWDVAPWGTVVDHVFENQDSMVFAIRNVPAEFLLGITLFGEEHALELPVPASVPDMGVYDLRIYPEYRADFAPDTDEENDHCFGATPLPSSSGSVDRSFDHGHDLDWYRLDVPGTPPAPALVGSESEPNDSFAAADTIAFGERVSGFLDTGDDYFTFHATAGEWIDIDLRSDRNDWQGLNSLVQLYFGGQLIALNDDLSITTFDSRITLKAPFTGWYHFAVQDVNNRHTGNHRYEVDLQRLTNESRNIILDVTPRGSPESGRFRPVVQVWTDELSTAGWVQLLDSGRDQTETVLVPGSYFILVYNQATLAAEYTLHFDAQPIS